MGDVTTAKQTTAPSDPDVNPTVSTLLKGLQSEYGKGVGVFNKSLYPGVGQTTQNAWQSTLGAANNPNYSNAIGGAISDFGDVAEGNRFGTDDPGYAALRAKAGQDALTGVNSIFSGSGRFGSGSHVDTATESLGNVYAGMDYQNYQNDIARQKSAADMLPGLYNASLAPSAVQGQVGAAQDADALARRQAENDLFRRQKDAGFENLARSSSVLAGTAPVGGQDSTKSVPWWQAALGAGTGLAGAFF